MTMPKLHHVEEELVIKMKTYTACVEPEGLNPRIETLVNELIGRVADKWTMLVLEVLAENGELRFTRLSKLIEGISQKMLAQILRHMERAGLLTRTVHPGYGHGRTAPPPEWRNGSRSRLGLSRRAG